MITASLVKELREKTGAGMMDCKKVLTETDGDMEKAAELLRERGITKAAKKSDRIAAEGLVYCYLTEDKKLGVVLEVNAETDFVAKNEEFRKFVADTAKHIAEKNPATVEELLEQKALADESKTIKDILTDKIATIGENMSIRRFARFESEGLVETYTHGDGKIGVMVEFAKGTSQVARDVCMQIAAQSPLHRNTVSVRRRCSHISIERSLSMLSEILNFNREFVARKDYLPYQTTKYPDRKLAILTCMDTRLTHLRLAALGLRNGEVKMIKNAGGVVLAPYGGVVRSPAGGGAGAGRGGDPGDRPHRLRRVRHAPRGDPAAPAGPGYCAGDSLGDR